MIVACLLVGGPTLAIQTSRGRVLFEMHPHCGPMPVGKMGKERDLGPRHPFWTAVTCWAQQGERVVDGVCVWEPEAHPLKGAVHAGGRNWVQADHPMAAALIAAGAKVHP